VCGPRRPNSSQHHGARAQDRLRVMLPGISLALSFQALRMADYDLAILGGGLNGVSVARDAAGRGLRVLLLEQGDLGCGASAASPRLIHGDLSVLERRDFLRVRTALAERGVWLAIVPHPVRPRCVV